MHRRIAISLVALAFVTAVQSDNQKCYMCTSLSKKGCGSEVKTDLVQPEECTSIKMGQWQKNIKQHNVLESIAWLFEVDDALQHHHGAPPNMDMACSKMTFQVANQDVIVRTCQTAKTEIIDPCKTIEGKLENNQLIKMDKCDLCPTDGCNNTTSISPDILYILLSFLGSLVHVAFYRLA